MWEKRIIEVFNQYYYNEGNLSKFINIDEELEKDGRRIIITMKIPIKTKFIQHLDYLFGTNGTIFADKREQISIIYREE